MDAIIFLFENQNVCFLKDVLVRLFSWISILSGENMDKESICTTNSIDFTTEIKNLHCYSSITYKNSEKSDKYHCNGGNGWRKEPKLTSMDNNVGVGKFLNCRTIIHITVEVLFISGFF